MNYVDIYETRDFFAAVSLRTVGFKLLRVEFNSQKIATFIYADPEKKASDVVAKFWDRELKADLRTFTEAINELKSRIVNRN